MLRSNENTTTQVKKAFLKLLLGAKPLPEVSKIHQKEKEKENPAPDNLRIEMLHPVILCRL